MTHNMKLHNQPFDLIMSGIKTIELRLNDDKRQKIKVGDTIVFTKTSDANEQITVRVINLHVFPSFAELYSTLPLDKCGYLPDELKNASPKDMEEYYSPEEQKRYGVLGIEIMLTNF